MQQNLTIYNTLTREKEKFEPINPPFVGLYVCGPTVYGEAHLGHSRPAITYDVLFRYLKYSGYKVRYVRNITDVGHLVNDADEGEDKITKKAKLDALEPMEIVQMYTNSYHRNMDLLNVLSPSIEPHASGHIIEQIQMIEQILDHGFAYQTDGSIYFDVEKYNQHHNYGKLSGRILDDLLANTRKLEGQQEKRNPFDFALWKKASTEHIMHWPSPWSEGFPGWHLECSAMSTKYLGDYFDIHGGGMDLMFPHHECEIAQSVAVLGKESVKYWMHNNMITINGQKMGKSLGNFINLDQFFSGNHSLLEKSYAPMTVRFFILQAHYRGTIDFSNEALQASEKGLERLMTSHKILQKISSSASNSVDIQGIITNSINAMNDDLNTPIVISHLFEAVKMINLIHAGTETINQENLDLLKQFFDDFLFTILGMRKDENHSENAEITGKLVDLILNLRMDAKSKKDFASSDKIRNELTNLGFEIKDKKDGFEWEFKG